MPEGGGYSFGYNQGLYFKGIVPSVPAAPANSFIVLGFIGLPAGTFNGTTNPYQVFVKTDAAGAGAAPQGEMQPVTAFNNATGQITTTAFTVPVGVGDEVLILHASLAKVLGGAGISNEKATTIDLNQAAATYDLFTGTGQVVMLESLVIQMPVGAAGGALTSISIQTNDATPQVIIPAAVGAVANLTSENQLYWTGKIRIAVGKKIQLTIAGGATGAGYVCNVVAESRAVVAGGSLT